MKPASIILVLSLVIVSLSLGQSAPTKPAAAPAPAPAAVPAPAPAAPAPVPAATQPASSPASTVDRIADALATVGMTEADLGFSPKGYWSRYPDRTPYKLHFFDSLFAEPLRIYEFTRIMTDAVGDNISLDKFQHDDRSLRRALFYLGIDPKVGGFRNFGVNLDPDLPEKTPLLWAAKAAYQAAGQRMRLVIFSDYYPKKVDWPDPEADIIKQTQNMDPRLEKIVADLLANIVEAYSWRQLALRNVDGKALREVFAMRSFHGHSSDGQDYPYQVDDVMKNLDEESLYYGAQKAVQAAQDTARKLKELVDKEPQKFKDVAIDFSTPIGRVVISGTGNDKHTGGNYAILIDLGGDDSYDGPVGATSSLDNPISVAIDLSGNDTYRCSDADAMAQGAGIFGAGILIDLTGNDTYEAGVGGQGYGLFGLGLLVDYQGKDTYKADFACQAAGYFGIGLCLSGQGGQSYYVLGDGQGFGGVGGVGVLGNAGGGNTYTAEPLVAKAGRPDYHSALKITVSQAQGCGGGTRADGSHGHAWAGGLGVLINEGGDNKFEAGNFAIGVGYWFGTGIVYNGGGNNSFHSICYSQAGGCHYAIGAIINEGGGNRHVAYDTSDACIASSRDYLVSLLLNKGGNNYFEAQTRSIAFAEVRSNALLINLGGGNTFVTTAGPDVLAAAAYDPQYAKPTYRGGPSARYGNSIALLLNIGGGNKYITRDFKTGKDTPSAIAGEGKTWYKPAKGTPEFGFRSYGIGMDVKDGTINELLTEPRP